MSVHPITETAGQLLLFGDGNATLPPATPDKRKGPCMARRGQVGTIEISGKWYVIRFWKYPAGKDKFYVSQKICPTDTNAPSYLPRGERRRRASEIVEASGVNDIEEFVASEGVTFRQQAKWFLNHSVNPKRHPVKQATIGSTIKARTIRSISRPYRAINCLSNFVRPRTASQTDPDARIFLPDSMNLKRRKGQMVSLLPTRVSWHRLHST